MSSVIDVQILKSLREARGWDQQTLAQVAGVDPSVVSRLERQLQDDLKASVLVALARALETPVDALLTAEYRYSHSELLAELTAVVNEFGRLSEGHQRQIAGMLRSYLF